MRLEAARRRVRDGLIERLRRALTAQPPADVEAVFLFGSLARGDFDGNSDVDLMVVGHRDGIDRAALLRLGRHVDVVLVSPEQFRRSQSPVVSAVRETGVRLWP